MLPYRESLLHSFGGRMWAVPNPCNVVLSNHRCPFNPELEQVVVLTLAGRDISQGLSLLHRLWTGDTTGDVEEDGFQLLAMKWLPTLSRQQVREEVCDRLWQSSLVGLASSPALVCALRRVDAFATLRQFLPRDYPGNLNILLSPTPELAFRQASLFFSLGDMIPDHSVRPLLKFLPPPRINVAGSQCESLLNCLVQGPQPLVTLPVQAWSVEPCSGENPQQSPAEWFHCGGPACAGSGQWHSCVTGVCCRESDNSRPLCRRSPCPVLELWAFPGSVPAEGERCEEATGCAGT
ncbi:uncharacterized protein LOC115171200 [Salmo trutta]|uniref:uncharacterized protein LOC115171200 n=1 Tax=Salmo trutta TaxID=8032 RepID=UPI0011313BF6|nr:uncharacterized protein LOC115171200 [Salmo trutta]XP_029583646.1 uncharacterized protein LOC115171200 [Salmo trutta]